MAKNNNRFKEKLLSIRIDIRKITFMGFYFDLRINENKRSALSTVLAIIQYDSNENTGYERFFFPSNKFIELSPKHTVNSTTTISAEN